MAQRRLYTECMLASQVETPFLFCLVWRPPVLIETTLHLGMAICDQSITLASLVFMCAVTGYFKDPCPHPLFNTSRVAQGIKYFNTMMPDTIIVNFAFKISLKRQQHPWVDYTSKILYFKLGFICAILYTIRSLEAPQISNEVSSISHI